MMRSTLASSARSPAAGLGALLRPRAMSARRTVASRSRAVRKDMERPMSFLCRRSQSRRGPRIVLISRQGNSRGFGAMTIARAGFDLHGHRGARGLWPENTLAGFSRTMALGVAAMEFDCLVTRDGVIVVTHDAQLNPDCTRDARGRFLESAGPPILALSYEELQSYDVGRLRPGSAYATRFPQQQAVDGERIPKLTDVLDLIRTHGGGRVRASIEVKSSPEKPAATLAPEPFVRLLAEAVRSTGMEAFTNILCFDWRVPPPPPPPLPPPPHPAPPRPPTPPSSGAAR